LAVLLGLRPSIASILRSFILPVQQPHSKNPSPLLELAEITQNLPSTKTTPCYIICSNGKETIVFEKDLATAHIRSSKTFIAQTNHDISCEGDHSHPSHASKMADMIGMDDLIEDSTERKDCIEAKWRSAVKQFCERHEGAGEDDVSVSIESVEGWMGCWPTANECTHYACVMDPTKGEVVWVRRWMRPKSK
jgi:hypothetical protein